MIVPLDAVWLAAHALYRARGFRSRTLTAAGFRVHLYERKGRGRAPAVLLVHGLGGNAYSFLPLLGTLVRESRRVVAIELPGHGRSPLATEPATIAECGAAVAAALETLGEPAVVIGNSLGGAIGLYTAAMLPERVAGFVGLNPAGAPLEGADRHAVIDAFRGGTVGAARELLRRLYHRPPRGGWLVAGGLAKHWASRPVQRLVDDLRAGDQPGIPAEVLAQIVGPVLILWGEHDRILPASSAEWFRAALKPGSVEVIPGSGHLPQLEQSRLVAARLTRFLRELPA